MDISLAGRTAVITGGSKGIGFAIASRFAGSGADVAIVARGRRRSMRRSKRSARAAADASWAFRAMSRSRSDIQRVYDEAVKALGKIESS